MNVGLFIDRLDVGGAQRQFALLADGLAGRGHRVTFFTLLPGGPNWDWLQARRAGRTLALYPARGATIAHRLAQLADAPRRLARALRASGVEVLYSALHTGDLLAWLATRLPPGAAPPVAWSLRSSRQKLDWKQRPPFELCRLVSGRVPLMVANSRTGLRVYQRLGFRPRSTAVIPNGIDPEVFRPDPEAGMRVRAAWGVAEGAPLVGIVGRLAPVKDHATFLRAAALVAPRAPGAVFACIGDGPAGYRAGLVEQARALGLAGRVIWVGERHDMPAVHNALDVLCLSSRVEGFPNVLGEAMAAGVPCVATDVGDVAEILDPVGRVVPVGDSAALGAALDELLALPPGARRQLGERARARVVEGYSVDAMVRRTEHALRALARGPAA
jgi:glycosyltransferase involved in cell wall biosynthesis